MNDSSKKKIKEIHYIKLKEESGFYHSPPRLIIRSGYGSNPGPLI